MSAGRPPTPYDRELAAELCDRWATEIKGIDEILDDLRIERGQDLSTPSRRVIYRWLDEIPEFRERSARARKLRADFLSDLRVKYALTPLIGEKTKLTSKGQETEIGDNVQRSQLIVQTLSKVIGQLDPKVYGEKTAITGDGGGPFAPGAPPRMSGSSGRPSRPRPRWPSTTRRRPTSAFSRSSSWSAVRPGTAATS